MPEAPQNFLPQALAVAYREHAAAREFCLVTSLSKRRWGFPKGLVDPGDTLPETALREAWEEAGVRGHLIGEPLGEYDDFKWDTPLVVTGFLMLVTEAADQWLEATIRQRAWVSADDAMKRIVNRGQRRLLTEALRRLGD